MLGSSVSRVQPHSLPAAFNQTQLKFWCDRFFQRWYTLFQMKHFQFFWVLETPVDACRLTGLELFWDCSETGLELFCDSKDIGRCSTRDAAPLSRVRVTNTAELFSEMHISIFHPELTGRNWKQQGNIN